MPITSTTTMATRPMKKRGRRTNMNILGLNIYHADASAVLLRDGQLIAALEEERFRRIKHFAGFPQMAIQRCLDMAGITSKEVDAIAISRSPKANLFKKATFVLGSRPGRQMLRNRFNHLRKVQDLRTTLAETLGMAVDSL